MPSGGGDEAQPPPGHGGMPCDSVQVQRARLDGGGQQTACLVGVRGSGMAGVAIAQRVKRCCSFHCMLNVAEPVIVGIGVPR